MNGLNRRHDHWAVSLVLVPCYRLHQLVATSLITLQSIGRMDFCMIRQRGTRSRFTIPMLAHLFGSQETQPEGQHLLDDCRVVVY